MNFIFGEQQAGATKKRRVFPVCILLSIVLCACVTRSSYAGSPFLKIGFGDQWVRSQPDFGTWLTRSRSAGSSMIRIEVNWAAVSPTAPPTDNDARNASWSGYRWTLLDNAVKTVVASGQKPLLMIHRTPVWARGSGSDTERSSPTWKPDPGAYGRFAQAVAGRYSGLTADPAAAGSVLPKVSEFQTWNEPNIAIFLAPQWENNVAVSPALFRQLNNAAYAGIKAAQPSSDVVLGPSAPNGVPPEIRQDSVMPAKFWREVFCLNENLKKKCNDVTNFDVFSHHPYLIDRQGAVQHPSTVEGYPDNVSVSGLHKLQTIILAAERAGTVSPGKKPIWATEFGIRTSPEYSGAPDANTQAAWTAESMWRLYTQGVTRIYFYLIAQVPNPAVSFNTAGFGAFTTAGSQRLQTKVTAFPVYAYRLGSKLKVWTSAPFSGSGQIQVAYKGRFRSVKQIKLSQQRPRTITINGTNVRKVRVKLGNATSYTWRMPK